MTDNLKVLVKEINKALKTEYNLISFDSLSVENQLQLLVDFLHHFNVNPKFDVRDTDPEETNKRILESLRKIQYRPNADPSDPGAFRRALLQGDKKTVYPIFGFIIENQEKIKQLAYLAKYLMPLDLPSEAIANAEIVQLWNGYNIVMDEFKEAHRAHQQSQEESAQFRELRSDIGAIDTEKENVRKRIERTQARLDKIPQQELLLEAAQALRIEKDRQKELQNQSNDQKQALNRANALHDRLQKELNNAKMATKGTSPQSMIEGLIEETQVLEFMVQQKLPQELVSKQSEIDILESIIDEPNISRDMLQDLQMQVDAVNREVQAIVDQKINDRGNQSDTLLPFRQQAAMVARNKELAAEQLDQATKELRELEQLLGQKQMLLQETVGEVILRGDDLKQYVNTLRTKSSVYKQQRAELAALRAEVTDLTQTLDNLKQQDPTLSSTLPTNEGDDSLDQSLTRLDSPVETRGMTELARLVDGLTRAVHAARERVTPLSQQIRPLRERVIELTEDRDSRKQTYESLSTQLTSETATFQAEVSDLKKTIAKMEDRWRDMQDEHNRMESLLEKAKDEMRSGGSGNASKISLKESLTTQIRELEEKCDQLKEETQTLIQSRDIRARQEEMWTDVIKILQVKDQCFREAKLRGPGGTLRVDQNAETFTLQ